MGDPLDSARRAVAGCGSLCVLTGAGVSAESGVPTFRGAGGMWRDRDPMSLATREAFDEDPATVWEWYQWRRGIIRRCAPNPGHRAIARVEREKDDFLLVTQNVDGLHRSAGSRKIVEFHGSIWTVRCLGCRREEEYREDYPVLPPRCRACNALLRPGVVWFGEEIPREALEASRAMIDRCEVLVVAGTSSVVYPAASFGEAVASRGGKVIEVNLEETPLSAAAHYSLRGKTGDILPLVLSLGKP